MKKRLEYHQKDLPLIVCDAHPEWVGLYDTAWQMAFANLDDPDKTGWKTQMTCMPGVGTLWQWDSCFMTLFGRYSNGLIPSMNNLDNLYRLQRRDGYISMAYRMASEEPAYGERINPPLYAWAEWDYYLMTGDDARFPKVFPRLERYYDWINRNRTRESGLYWFEDTGSTGMDNSPRSGWPAQARNGSDVSFIDLICQQALGALHLSRIAGHLGDRGKARRFQEEHGRLKALTNQCHWCERLGIYLDVLGRSGDYGPNIHLNHKTIASFWPMVSGVAEERHVRRLIEHLLNPEEFWTIHPLPSLSRDDPNYDALGGYWLGAVWAPTNYMVVRGLAQHGRHDLAREIAVRHLDAMCEVKRAETYGGIWECYSPEFMRPASRADGKMVRPNFVGWSGLGPIAMLIENVLGFQFDARANHVTWTVDTPGHHGIRNVLFNGKRLSMTCQGVQPATGKREIDVSTSGPVKVTVRAMGSEGVTRSFRGGEHAFTLGG